MVGHHANPNVGNTGNIKDEASNINVTQQFDHGQETRLLIINSNEEAKQRLLQGVIQPPV